MAGRRNMSNQGFNSKKRFKSPNPASRILKLEGKIQSKSPLIIKKVPQSVYPKGV